MDFVVKLAMRAAILGACTISLAACMSSPTVPEKHVSTTRKFSQFPAHAGTVSQGEDLLLALKSRRLTMDAAGNVYPYRGGYCKAKLLYSATPENLNTIFEHGFDLFGGVFFDLDWDGDDWEVLNSRQKSNPEVKKEDFDDILSEHAKTLSKYSLFVKLPDNLNEESLEELAELFTDNSLSMPAVVFANRGDYVKVRQSSFRASQFYFNKTEAVEDQFFFAAGDYTADIDMVYQLVDSKPVLRNIILDKDYFYACSATGSFVTKPTLNLTEAVEFTSLNLIRGLPADADFTQLSLQQELLVKGKYLTWQGEEADYRFINAREDKCLSAEADSEVANRCRDRERDADQISKEEKVRFKW